MIIADIVSLKTCRCKMVQKMTYLQRDNCWIWCDAAVVVCLFFVALSGIVNSRCNNSNDRR